MPSPRRSKSPRRKTSSTRKSPPKRRHYKSFTVGDVEKIQRDVQFDIYRDIQQARSYVAAVGAVMTELYRKIGHNEELHALLNNLHARVTEDLQAFQKGRLEQRECCRYYEKYKKEATEIFQAYLELMQESEKNLVIRKTASIVRRFVKALPERGSGTSRYTAAQRDILYEQHRNEIKKVGQEIARLAKYVVTTMPTHADDIALESAEDRGAPSVRHVSRTHTSGARDLVVKLRF